MIVNLFVYFIYRLINNDENTVTKVLIVLRLLIHLISQYLGPLDLDDFYSLVWNR